MKTPSPTRRGETSSDGAVSARLGSRVAVEDGSEVGLLKAGFNRMVGGLAERERLRDAFGVPIILRHGGHANKFIGDGLLAIFGAPDRLSDHAERAVAAALGAERNRRRARRVGDA